ncbi:hypothetical protein GCM10025794_32860 [Massilia kyonggiensis]
MVTMVQDYDLLGHEKKKTIVEDEKALLLCYTVPYSTSLKTPPTHAQNQKVSQGISKV